MDEGSQDEAVAAFIDLGATGPEGYAGLSFMRAAAIREDQGDVLGAVRLFDKAAEAFTIPRHKQLAQLKAAYLLADQGAYSDVVSRMTALIEKDAPYEYLARELLGFAYAESGDQDAASGQFSFLTSIPGVPASVKQRAEQSMALIGAKAALAAPEPISEPISEPATETQEDATDEE